MSRRPAAITQADVAQAIRAAKQTGAAEIEIRIGEQLSIVIRLNSSTGVDKPLAPAGEIVL
jgi:DNA-binding XRE family transcriptional regulator